MASTAQPSPVATSIEQAIGTRQAITFLGDGESEPRRNLQDPATQLDGRVLAQLIRDARPHSVVRIIGLNIDGQLDLSGCRLDLTLALESCWFETECILDGAQLTALSLRASEFLFLRARALKTSASIDLSDARCNGVDLSSARCGGRVLFDRARILPLSSARGNRLGRVAQTRAAGFGVLNLASARIEGDLSATLTSVQAGWFDLTNAHVHGPTDLGGASVNVPRGTEHSVAVLADGADLGAFTADPPLHAPSTFFTTLGTVSLRDAKVRGVVRLDGARLTSPRPRGEALDASRAQLGAVNLRGTESRAFEAHGTVTLAGARIAGNVDLNGAELLSDTGGIALNLDRATAESVRCSTTRNRDFRATGALRFVGSRFSGQLDLTRADVASDRVGGTLVLANANIRDEVLLSGSTIANAATPAIAVQGDRCEVGGVFANTSGGYPFRASGTLRLVGAKLRGELSLRSARLTAGAQHGIALHADRSQIAGVYCHPDAHGELLADHHGPFIAEGMVRFVGAAIAGPVNLTAGRVTSSHPDGALALAHAVVRNDVRLNGAQLRATSLSGAHALNAEHLDAARVDAHPTVGSSPFVTHGAVRLLGARVSSDVDLSGAVVDATGDEPSLNLANAVIGNRLCLDRAAVFAALPLDTAIDGDDMSAASISCMAGFTTEGSSHFMGCRVKGRITISGARLLAHTDQGLALALDAASADELIWTDSEALGHVSLSGTSVRQLTTDGPERFPSDFNLGGLRYERWLRHPAHPHQPITRWQRWGGSRPSWQIEIVARSTGAKTAGHSQRSPRSLQPFEQLATVLRNQGDDAAARNALFERERQSARQDHNRWRKLFAFGYRLVAGYGFRAWKAVIGLGCLWLVALAATAAATQTSDIRLRTPPARPAGSTCIESSIGLTRCFPVVDDRRPRVELSTPQKLVYATERVLPAVDLGERTRLTVRGVPALVLGVVTVLGWVLTIAIVAALTKTLRRDH